MSSTVQKAITDLAEKKQRIFDKVQNNNIKPTDEEQKHVDAIISYIASAYSAEFDTLGIGNQDLRDRIERTVKIETEKLNVSHESQLRIQKVVMLTAFGYGPLTPLIEDESVTEIIVIGHDRILVERHGKLEKSEITFSNEEQLMKIINRIAQSANRQPSQIHPIVDMELSNGSRVNVVCPPIAEHPQMNIRKFRKDMMDYATYISTGAITPYAMRFLQNCVRGKLNTIISGGTGTGKTTMLNALSNFIPRDELLAVIEDTRELQLQQDNVMYMRTRPSNSPEIDNITQGELLKASLRKRPDRIIQGEARDGSIFDFFDAMSTGHEGSLATIHANSPQDMCHSRIPNLFRRRSDMNMSDYGIQQYIAIAVEIIVQLKRYPQTGKRRVVAISYVDGVVDEKVNVVDIYKYDVETDVLVWTGAVLPERIMEKLRDNGVQKITYK